MTLFDILRTLYLFWIALFGYFLFAYLVFGAPIPQAVAAICLGIGVLINVIRFATSWDVEKEINDV